MIRLTLFFTCFLLAAPCWARLITVDDNNPADFNNIQAAINDAINGDIVEVKPGVYTGNGNRDIDFGGKAITVRSIDPNNHSIVAATVIDCNGSEAIPHRGFNFNAGEGPNTILDGFTITNGYILDCGGYGGGGINTSNSSPTIKNCVILSCHVQVPSICLGFCMGGGISIDDKDYQSPDSSPLILNCTISDNTADAFGWGGGIYSNSNGLPVIRNCVISKNKATSLRGSGGGVYCAYCSSIHIANCTITENKALEEGSGIWCGPDTQIKNCIVWNNYDDEICGFPKVQYSNVKNGYPGNGNIDVYPYFVDTNSNIYHLKSEGWRWDINTGQWTWDNVTSRCIDAGNPGCDPADEPLANSSNRINMGAYGGTAEASIPPHGWALLADLNNDGIVNFADYAEQVTDWFNEEDCQSGDINRDSIINMFDLALFAEDWLRTTTWKSGN